MNIADIPFSRYGSYFAFSVDRKTGHLMLRDLHGGDEAPSNIFELQLMQNGVPVDYDLDVTETRLRLVHRDQPQQWAELCISDEDVIRGIMNGVSLQLTALKSRYDSLMPYGIGQWEYHLYTKEIKLMITVLS